MFPTKRGRVTQGAGSTETGYSKRRERAALKDEVVAQKKRRKRKGLRIQAAGKSRPSYEGQQRAGPMGGLRRKHRLPLSPAGFYKLGKTKGFS